MQKDPLVPRAQAEQIADLVAGKAVYVAQHDDLSLARREVFKAGLKNRTPRRGIQAVLGVLVPPLHRVGPLPVRVKADGIDGM